MGWLDVLNLAVDIGQSYQLQKIQGQVGAMQAGTLEERFRQQVIEALKNTIFSVNQDLKEIQSRVREFPKQVYVASRVLEWRLGYFNITPGIFPALTDKEYAQNVIQGIKDVKSQSDQLLDLETIEEAEKVSKELIEIPQLNEWINTFYTYNKIQGVEAELAQYRSTSSSKALWGTLALIGSMFLCVAGGIGSNSGSEGSFLILLAIGATILGIYLFASRKNSASKELNNQLQQLKVEMPGNDRLQELRQIYINLTLEDCERLKEQKIAFVQSFMGDFKGFETSNVLPIG